MRYNIIIVGCGGTGGNFIKELGRFLYRASIKNSCSILLIDGDLVEEHNVSRQPFLPEDVGRKRALSELLHTREFPDSWLPLFWKNLSKIERSYGSMEDGEIIIMQNRSIGAYKKFRREHKEMVHNYFAEEEQAIEDVLDDLMYPLTYTNVHDNGYLGDNYYIYFDTGCDGYNHLSFSMLSMQWVISCVVLGKLLRDFRDKVYQLMDIQLEFGLIS